MVTFQSLLPIYDNRKAVVSLGTDEWDDSPAYHAWGDGIRKAIDACLERNLPLTLFIITKGYGGGGEPVWSDVQNAVNRNPLLIEAASHSRTHPHPPYSDYYGEIIGSKNDILSHLSLPLGQYVYSWADPYGEGDSTQRAYVVQGKYLVHRSTASGTSSFASFEPSNNTFSRYGYSIRAGVDGTTNLSTLNSTFDSIYNAGGFYHLMFHSKETTIAGDYGVSYDPSAYFIQHLNHIQGKKDCWYAPLGFIYLTRYAYVKNLVSVMPSQLPPQNFARRRLPVKTSDDFFNGIEYVRQDGSTLYVGVNFKESNEVYLDFAKSAEIFKVSVPREEWENYGFQYPVTLKFTNVPAGEEVTKLYPSAQAIPSAFLDYVINVSSSILFLNVVWQWLLRRIREAKARWKG